jgi:hypothetical protein
MPINCRVNRYVQCTHPTGCRDSGFPALPWSTPLKLIRLASKGSGTVLRKKGSIGVGERIRADLFGDPETRFERDPALQPSPEVIGEAAPRRMDPPSQRDVGAQLEAQQRGQHERRVRDVAPQIGRTAVDAQRRDETKQAVTRQLGYKAVERARLEDRK